MIKWLIFIFLKLFNLNFDTMPNFKNQKFEKIKKKKKKGGVEPIL